MKKFALLLQKPNAEIYCLLILGILSLPLIFIPMNSLLFVYLSIAFLIGMFVYSYISGYSLGGVSLETNTKQFITKFMSESALFYFMLFCSFFYIYDLLLCDGINRSLGAFTVSSEKVSEILEKYPSLSLPAPNLRVLSIDVLFVANCLFYRTVGRRAAEKSLQKE